MQSFFDRLLEQEKQHLWRERLCVDARKNTHWQIASENYLSFMNNDYLGLAQHEQVISALQQGAKKYGVGSSASPLLGGYHHAHKQLEQSIATFTGFERALVFSTGYLANLSVIQTVVAKEDDVFEHRLNHASLIDAARTTNANIKRFRHLDQLEQQLKHSTAIKKWIISDAVFSMDGLIAPLPEYIALAKQYNAYLILDDAHGIGILGRKGAGIIEHYLVAAKDVTLLTGVFGKAFGGQGGFVAGNTMFIEYLIQFSRGYRYSTALSPALAQANRISISLAEKEDWRRRHLNELIKYFTDLAQVHKIDFCLSDTPIQILILRDSEKTLAIMAALKKKNILVGAIRPPTVAANAARLRINLSALHSKQDIFYLFDALKPLCS